MPRQTSPDNDPMGMTVHSMPSTDSVLTDTQARTRVGRWKMLLLFLICASPVVASYFTYYVIRPEGRRNYGDLITPQRALPDLVATTISGDRVNLQTLKDQWLLISVGSGACASQCAQHLYMQRQMRETLGKEKDRLDWVWLVDDAEPVAQAIQPGLKDATVLRVNREAISRWLEPAQGHGLADHLYVVDPLGNWMMRFPANLDLKDGAPKAKRDLERLLRASNAWDKPGRQPNAVAP
ncbi:hypothetical protein [Rhodoferax aquaticus]|uniref:Cytochrome C oxidase subunit I n=1 Tax=Rhodoferax aquaticus TaxID=2527691 RepID=A0A515ESM7_9BURK|nr:hypothetical protein [Rhodoferax aquaticus]QDL55670.1 hypothetical protein EXZ61_16660 [Rhodoferax aquaticus]